MNTTFKKGTRCWLLRSWDNKGTVAKTEVEIIARGAKRMVLCVADSPRMLGQDFNPEAIGEANVDTYFHAYGIYPLDCDIDAAALAFGARVVAHKRAGIERCINKNGDDSNYVRAMRQELAALHEPRVIARPEAA